MLMTKRITFIAGRAEITPFADDGKVTPRSAPAAFQAFESEIPPEVDAWLRKIMKMED